MELTVGKFEEFLAALDEIKHKYSKDAYVATYDMVYLWQQELDYYEGELIYDVYSLVYEAIANHFMYHSEAFDYLRDTNTFDFKDAISEGYGDNIVSIATYYIEQEIFGMLHEIGLLSYIEEVGLQ